MNFLELKSLVTIWARLFSLVLLVTCQEETAPPKPEDFTKLKLNTKALLGSRWALEQSKEITVFHAFDIVDIERVDTNGMSIRIDFHVKQRWEADGLEFPDGLFKETDGPNVFLSAEEAVLNSMWSPDSYIPNARETKIQSTSATQSVVNLYRNKTILYKARMYAVLGCSFTFEWYPLDIQVCDLIFESHKYTADKVHYGWEKGNPVAVSDSIILYQYDLKTPLKTLTGNHVRWGSKVGYPYVKIPFKFERKLGNNIIQVYTPTTLVVVLSFFSFWLGLDAVPGRISLLITCILTLVTMHGGLKGAVPPVHYIKMIDIWVIGCMVFVFGAIFEFVVVKYMKWSATQKKNAEEEREKYLKNVGMMMNPTFPPGAGQGFHHPGMHMNAYTPPPNYNQLRHSNGHGDGFSVSKSKRPPVMHTADKGQAWELPNSVPHHRHHDEYPPPGVHPGLGNMHPMAIYDQQMIPPPTTPTWVKIDRVCRLVFPVLFLIFTGAYWPILILGSAKQHQDA